MIDLYDDGEVILPEDPGKHWVLTPRKVDGDFTEWLDHLSKKGLIFHGKFNANSFVFRMEDSFESRVHDYLKNNLRMDIVPSSRFGDIGSSDPYHTVRIFLGEELITEADIDD